MVHTRRQRIALLVRQRLRETQALAVLSNQYSRRLRRENERVLARLDHQTVRENSKLLAHLDEQLEYLVKLLRPTLKPAQLVRFLEASEPRPNRFLWAPRWRLRELVPGLESYHHRLTELPQHARLRLDIHGLEPEGGPGEVRILEASLFEDMCALVNAAVAMEPHDGSQLARKQLSAFRRAAVLAAFNVVEAYINSIGFDTVIARAGALSERDRDLLSEWDSKRDRQRLVNLRDKLLHYPRIAIGAAHPPIQESNCPEYALLLGIAKEFRDAIVHANPKPTTTPLEPEDPEPRKEMLHWQLAGVDDVQPAGPTRPPVPSWLEIVDASIGAIRRIEAEVHPKEQRLFWLHDRQATGSFPDVVFA